MSDVLCIYYSFSGNTRRAMKEIADEVGAKFWVDMAHFAGLVAAGLHPSPVPYADVVSSTAHKTLGGPRSGFILAKQEYAKKLNSAVFPGQQGGPLMHVIAGKAVAFKVAATPEFKDRMQRTLDGAKILAERLMADDVKNNGISVLTGGTDVHLVMVDLRNSEMDGKQGEDLLAQCGITINRNTVPFDPRPASVASGLRIGPRLRTQGIRGSRRHHRHRSRRRTGRRRRRAQGARRQACRRLPALPGTRPNPLITSLD